MAKQGEQIGGRARLERDNQQWVLDYLIQETGKVFHFQGDGRGGLPRSVRSHAMISKHVGMAARRLEALGEAEEAAGHGLTALDFYWKASNEYASAQHVIFEVNEEKRFLYAGVRRCFDKVMALAPYRLEHLDIPWNGTLVSGNLHLMPGAKKAPLLFFINGCDVTKEGWPHPLFNQAHMRGMHVFAFDGPGQAESNLRGIKLTADNYEEAASTALDVLVKRPEIDADRVVVFSRSFGSFWGLRLAARDARVKAIAAPAASYTGKRYLMDIETPRWKQLFAFLTQAGSEAELDATVEAMTMEGYMERITCPALLAAGEYDPRSPLEEVYAAFDELRGPKELWVMADQHHMPAIGGAGSGFGAPLDSIMCDWLRDRLEGKALRHDGKSLYLDGGTAGPYAARVSARRRWFSTGD